MPSSIGHALVAVTVAAALRPRPTPRRLWLVAAACAVVPDLDAIGWPFGLPAIAWLGGHRALTHSLLFAAGLGALVGAIYTRAPEWRGSRLRLCGILAIATATHGILDALTTYGAGVTFFAPFWWMRFKFGWEPLTGVFAEVLFLWLPAMCILRWAPFARGMWSPITDPARAA
jgi:inner membrane protein